MFTNIQGDHLKTWHFILYIQKYAYWSLWIECKGSDYYLNIQILYIFKGVKIVENFNCKNTKRSSFKKNIYFTRSRFKVFHKSYLILYGNWWFLLVKILTLAGNRKFISHSVPVFLRFKLSTISSPYENIRSGASNDGLIIALEWTMMGKNVSKYKCCIFISFVF